MARRRIHRHPRGSRLPPRIHQWLSAQSVRIRHHAVLCLLHSQLHLQWSPQRRCHGPHRRRVRRGRRHRRAGRKRLEQPPRASFPAALAVGELCTRHPCRLWPGICPLGLRHSLLHSGQRLPRGLVACRHDPIQQCLQHVPALDISPSDGACGGHHGGVPLPAGGHLPPPALA